VAFVLTRREERDFALRYLVHFMGDLHMPLHLTGRDRGGNNSALSSIILLQCITEKAQ
jgi:hypothetical protein